MPPPRWPFRRTETAIRVLEVLLHNPDKELYGFEIVKLTGIESGSTYPVLSRFFDAGWVTIRQESGSAKSLRRPLRLYYRLTQLGKSLAQSFVSGIPVANTFRGESPVILVATDIGVEVRDGLVQGSSASFALTFEQAETLLRALAADSPSLEEGQSLALRLDESTTFMASTIATSHQTEYLVWFEGPSGRPHHLLRLSGEEFSHFIADAGQLAAQLQAWLTIHRLPARS